MNRANPQYLIEDHVLEYIHILFLDIYPNHKMSVLEKLSLRFGTPAYYQDCFSDIDRSSIEEDFKKFNSDRHKSTDSYEIRRQQFLKLLGQNKMIWYPTNGDLDLFVEVSRIYRRDRREFLAFMRIQPSGFRAERLVPAGVEIVFHVLIGRVIFAHRRRIRTMNKGNSITVAPRSTYSIRCLTDDQPAYLIFRVVDYGKRRNSTKS